MELMTSHRNYQWLHNLVTGDEKWVLYISYEYHRQWLSPGQTVAVTPKPDLHPKKVMLSVWWSVRGIIHWEILSDGCTITADLYCQQLNRVAAKLKGKQDRIYFFARRCQIRRSKVDTSKVIKPRMDHYSPSTLLSRFGSNRLSSVPFSL